MLEYTYPEYLKSGDWYFRKKRFIASLLSKECFICTINEAGHLNRLRYQTVGDLTPERTIFHVHHCNYSNLGDEKDDDLVLLCDVCHRNLHDLLSGNKFGLQLIDAHIKMRDSDFLRNFFE